MLALPKLSPVRIVSKKQTPPYPSHTTNRSGYPIHRSHALGGLADDLGLLGVRPGRPRHDALAAQELGQADLGVDLLHALEVGLGRALGAEDDVLFVTC